MKTLLAAAIPLVLIAALAIAATTHSEGPSRDYPNRVVAIGFDNNVGTSTWVNTSWTRLASVGVAMTNSLSSTTNKISVVRTEGVTEDLATITGDMSSFRWSALTDMDVILRPGDTLKITMSVITNGGGYVYANLEL